MISKETSALDGDLIFSNKKIVKIQGPMNTSVEQILLTLKSDGAKSTSALAECLGVSRQAARQHLERLAGMGLVAHDVERGAVGRPRRLWGLTEASQARFPDGHAQAIVELLDAARSEFGEAGVDRLISRREQGAQAANQERLSTARTLGERVAMLAAIRTAEGYMAGWSRQDDGSFLMVENHCPICAAATACQGFCRSEIQIFQEVLGAGALVTRTEHILAGARRCAYRIETRSGVLPDA